MSLVARYPFYPQSGSALIDSVGGRNGVIAGAPVYGAFTNGVQRLRFDGVDDQVDMPGDDLWRETINNFSPFSIALWVRASVGAVGVFVSTWNVPNQAGCRIMVGDPSPDRVSFLLTNATASAFKQVFTTDSFIGDSALHHLVVTHDGSGTVAGMKIYKDGVLQTTTVNSDGSLAGVNPADWSNNFHIAGNFGTLHQYLGGDVGDVSVYDHELSQVEITALFNDPEVEVFVPKFEAEFIERIVENITAVLERDANAALDAIDTDLRKFVTFNIPTQITTNFPALFVEPSRSDLQQSDDDAYILEEHEVAISVVAVAPTAEASKLNLMPYVRAIDQVIRTMSVVDLIGAGMPTAKVRKPSWEVTQHNYGVLRANEQTIYRRDAQLILTVQMLEQ